MWSKFTKHIWGNVSGRPTSTGQSTSNLPSNVSLTSKPSPFKSRQFTPTPKSLSEISKTRLSFLSSVLSQKIATLKSQAMSITRNDGNMMPSAWHKAWSQYKISPPPGARQQHFSTIRNAIMTKYGVLGDRILLILSAIVTDAVFWWLAELLLDDGM